MIDATRERLGTTLVWLAILCLGLSTIAGTTDGFGGAIGGVRVSLHNPTRPLLAALVLGAIGVWLAGPSRTRAPFAGAQRIVAGGAPWAAAVLAMAVLAGTTRCGAFVAGGADSAGYLSQARLWRAGDLHVETPLARELALANGQQPFSPLGYRPATDRGFVVPSYPPGFPMMLAVAGVARAEWLVVPLTAAGLVLLTYLLGRRLGGRVAGALGAATTAASPIVWYQAVQPMSDVPAAFWWTLSVLFLIGDSRASAFAAGVAAAMGALVRPNLFAVAPILAVSAVWWDHPSRRGWERAALFGMPIAAAALGFILFQRVMYGAATETGYGGVTYLFSLDHVLPNLARYPVWLVSAHSALLLLAIGAPWAMRRRDQSTPAATERARRIVWSGLALFAALLAFYALYFVFDEWVYIRFLLPALAWLFALVGVSMAAVCRQSPGGSAGLAAIVALLVVVNLGLERARGLGAFRLMHSERRYVAAAEFLREVPPDAVVLAMQHSGSVSYYTGRPILRWDWVEAAEIDRTLAELDERGRPVYAVLEDWEEPQVLARFAATRLARLPPPLFATGVPEGIIARVYALSGTTALAGDGAVSSTPPPAPRTRRRPAG